jgi:hypothetical protein
MMRSESRRVLGWAALAAGLGASALAVLLAVQAARPPADVGVLPAAAPPPPVRIASPSAPPPPARIASPSAPPAGDAANGNALTGWAAPARITIGALRVNAPVDPVGVRADRALAVPDDPDRIGWWIGSATPGSPRGTVLLAGHVDTAGNGPGALFRLESMPMGSTVQVWAGGRTTSYRAVARRSFDKRKLPADLFDPATAPRLVLVTCGGTFHAGTYSHNVVVYAEPVRAAS